MSDALPPGVTALDDAAVTPLPDSGLPPGVEPLDTQPGVGAGTGSERASAPAPEFKGPRVENESFWSGLKGAVSTQPIYRAGAVKPLEYLSQKGEAVGRFLGGAAEDAIRGTAGVSGTPMAPPDIHSDAALTTAPSPTLPSGRAIGGFLGQAVTNPLTYVGTGGAVSGLLRKGMGAAADAAVPTTAEKLAGMFGRAKAGAEYRPTFEPPKTPVKTPYTDTTPLSVTSTPDVRQPLLTTQMDVAHKRAGMTPLVEPANQQRVVGMETPRPLDPTPPANTAPGLLARAAGVRDPATVSAEWNTKLDLQTQHWAIDAEQQIDRALQPGLGGKIAGSEAGLARPAVLSALARAAVGGAIGGATGDTTEERITHALIGAGLGAAASPAVAKAVWNRIADGRYARSVSNLKGRMNAGHVFSWPVADVARGVPEAESLVEKTFAAANTERAIISHFAQQVDSIYRGLPKESALRIRDFLNGEPVALNDAERAAAPRVRALFDSGADISNFPREYRIDNYFPKLREKVQITNLMQIDHTGPEYVPTVIAEKARDYVPFYMKQRTTNEPPSDLDGLTPIRAFIAGVAKRTAMKGGINPATGKPVVGLLDNLGDELANMPDQLKPYWATYLNDQLGVPRPGAVEPMMSQDTVNAIKSLQFVRTIAFNPASVVNNALQMGNTFAKVDPRSWTLAIMDGFKNLDRAKAAGIITDMTRGDIDRLIGNTPFQKGLQATTDVGGYAFQKVEQWLRLHAFSAGLRDAERAGLTGDAADAYARKIVDLTQFQYGKESLGQSMRTPGAGQLMGQFKPYAAHQAVFLKNLASDAIRFTDGKYSGDFGKSLAKYLALVTAVGGTDAALMGFDKTIKEAITGDRTMPVWTRGLFPMVGIYLGQQLGLGNLPIENFRSLMFMLPGPALSMVLDAASVVSGYRLSAEYVGDKWGTPATPDERAKLATRSIPLAGVMADRVRRSYLQYMGGGSERESQSMSEAFGLTPQSGPLKREGTQLDTAKTALGFTPEEKQQAMTAREEIGKNTAAHRDYVRRYSDAIAGGRTDIADALRKNFEAQYGYVPTVTQSARHEASKRQVTPALQRQIQKTPRQTRSHAREISEP